MPLKPNLLAFHRKARRAVPHWLRRRDDRGHRASRRRSGWGAARCAAGLAALEPILGAEHPHLMAALVCLGEIALARGKDGEARELLERALRAAGDGFEVTRADRGHVRQALARALAAGGEVGVGGQ